jgi:hypothetical protein
VPSLTQEKGQLLTEWVTGMRTQVTQQLVIIERLSCLGTLMAEWDLTPDEISAWTQTDEGAEVTVRGEVQLLAGFDIRPMQMMLKKG